LQVFFQGKSPSDRAKLKPDSEVVIDGVKVPVDQALCNEAFVISDIFNLNEMDALELVLSGNRGLIAVVCYYDMHRLLAVILRMVLKWEKDSMSDVLRSFIEQNFVQRTVFQQLLPNSVTVVLTNLVKEIRNETLWSDQSVCGTVQLQCALCATHVRVVDTLLKQLIALFPAKSSKLERCFQLMEIERNSEDELTWVDEMSEKGQQATPALYYENFLRCISDLYRVVGDPEASAAVKTCVIELSTSYSSSGSVGFTPHLHRALVFPTFDFTSFSWSCVVSWNALVFHTMSFTPLLIWIFCVQRMYWLGPCNVGIALIRKIVPREIQCSVYVWVGHSLPAQQQSKADIPPRELIGLITWVNLARTDDEAAEIFLEERQWAVLDAALGVVSAPVPLPLKGALLRLVAALAKKESSALRIWNALNAHRLCTFAENGTLLGLQVLIMVLKFHKELDERECVEEMFDTSLGFVSILRSLFSHPYIAVPDFAAPYLQYLTKSIVSQMASRSYKDIEQFYELEEISLSALLFLLKQSYVNSRAILCKEPHVAMLAQILNDTPVYRAICSVLIEDVSIQDQTARSYRRTSAPALPAIHLLSVAVSRYAMLRASIRAGDSNMMLAPLHALLLSPLQPSGLNILDIVLLYIEEADDLPCHALYAARILRELCAIRPSLQSHMVELLRAHKMVARNARAIRSVLNPSTIRYTVSDMVALDSVESDPARNNLCFLLFGFKTTADGSGQLYDVAFLLQQVYYYYYFSLILESQPTGFHQVLSILEQFVAAQNPLQLPFSALIEPSFRLLDDSEGPARLSVTRMISGSILHLTALEISSLLKTGHFNKPQKMYSALLEASEAVTCHQGEVEAGVDNLLFSLLRHGRIELSEEIAYPRLVHFNAHRLHMLFDTCKTTTVFNVAQYDIEYLHVLLVREIVSTQAEDTTTATRVSIQNSAALLKLPKVLFSGAMIGLVCVCGNVKMTNAIVLSSSTRMNIRLDIR
uniref:FA complementation group C n=1 Tax=Angiostrongylus costaricensis TaxID=334426 RepID=A0A0R3PEP4_ANGCS